jgi:carbon-monoxide dehydrogenase large subunit
VGELLPEAALVGGDESAPRVRLEVVGIFNNRTPTGPYRGAAHPEPTFLLERMVDELAGELAMDPADDSGDYAANLDAALELAGSRSRPTAGWIGGTA